MIEAKNLVKRYGATIAVNDVSFRASSGEIVGFLGPNGAGKSTTLKILTCYIVADSGDVSVAGHDVLENSLEVRRSIGYLPESTPLYGDMRVQDYLRFIARARQVPQDKWKSRFDTVVELTGIAPMLRKNIAHLSKGFKQRVGLAQAMIHDPPILILDEPTSGLDPHQIIEIRHLIRELGKHKLVLFSSHIMQEISAVCTRLIVIKGGRLVANGTPDELVRSVSGGVGLRVRVEGPPAGVVDKLRGLSGVTEAHEVERVNGTVDFLVHSAVGSDVGGAIAALAGSAGWKLTRLSEDRSSLEEVYLALTETKG